LLLNQPVHDLDFAVPGPTLALARQVADMLGGGLYVMDEQRDTTRVVLDSGGSQRLMLDFATLRADDLEGDLRSRDFTINAMAFEVSTPNKLIDPTGGLADLREKRIRACLPTSLHDDPARVLRAVRQALSFQFHIEPDTIRQIRAAAPLLGRISPERQRDELFKMLGGSHVARAIQLLDHLGVLPAVLPELKDMQGVAQSEPHVDNVWEHTLSVAAHLELLLAVLVGAYPQESPADLMTGLAVMRLGRYREQFEQHFAQSFNPDRSQRALLFLAALYHDAAKPRTRSEEAGGKVRFLGHPEQGAQVITERGRALALSNDEIQRLERIVNEHMRCHFMTTTRLTDGELPSRRTIFRYFRAAGAAGVDICLLSLADVRGTYGITLQQETWLAELDVCRALLEAYWEQEEQVVSPPRLISGHDLIDQFKMKPGRMIGRLLDAIRESQAAGEISSRNDAEEFARRWLAQPPAELEEGEG
jgi:tRNA nucleotidyltransferase/poly(A) polymerase